MKCYVCDKEDWIKVEGYSLSKEMVCCRNCGNLAYISNPEDEEKLKEHYDKNYRKLGIGVNNLITTNRKLNHITEFLKDYLESENRQLVVGDVGCATGYLVSWFRSLGHKATGSEWTTSMRRMCEHFYGFPATVELETKHKYDLIVMYHTLEHMSQPDQKLKHYRSLLSENGKIMVSCPEWFNLLVEPGMGDVSTFENVFHPDHIDIFSHKSLNNLFKKCGLKQIKEQRNSYGQDYLLEKCEPSQEFQNEEPEEVIGNIKKYSKAIKAYRQEKYREAIDIWPKFPMAYTKLIFNTEKRKDIGKCKELFQEALTQMPDELTVKSALMQWFYQQQEYEKAIEIGEQIIKLRKSEDIYMYLGNSCLHLKKYKEAMSYYSVVTKINPGQWKSAMGFVCKCATSIPTWDETAKDQLKDKLFQQANVKLSPQDPAFKEEKPIANQETI